MPDPETRQQYEELYKRNHIIRGSGEDAVHSFPCWACGAPDWYESSKQDMAHSTDDIYCTECGRSARFIYTEAKPAHVVKDRVSGEDVMVAGSMARIELVQTYGPPSPPWMQPSPRRVEPE